MGRVPRLSDDLFDIPSSYFDRGDRFWIALDEAGRVIGTLGAKTVSPTDLWLKRLFVKPERKRNGVASALLKTLEDFAASRNITTLHTRFPDDFYEAALFYPAKGFRETERSEGLRHFVKRLPDAEEF